MLVSKYSNLKFSMFITGFSALLVQMIYMREFLNVFSGNELIVGIILGNWMLLTAIGAKIAGSMLLDILNIKKIITSQLFIALLIPVSVLSIYWAKAQFYPPGTLPAFYGSSLFCLIVMAPFCLVSGGLFTFLADGFSKLTGRQQAPKVYGLEAFGSVVGGLLFTFVLLQYFSSFQIVFAVSAINIFAALLLIPFRLNALVKRLLLLVFIFVLLILPFIINFDGLAKSFIFENQTIVLSKDTPFGNLTVTQTGGQYNFYENGISLFSTDDLIANEEAVHYAMAQPKNPQSVLVVSGDIGGMTREISKYDVGKIDFVEINPYLIEAMQNFVGLPDDILTIHIADARKYISETQTKYDVVLLNLPAPASLQLNRFYSVEFFKRIKKILNPGAVISIPFQGGSNYLGDEARNFIGILQKTLLSEFKHVIVYPGESNYFLASDDSLEFDISKILQERGIKNEFVNHYYIDDDIARKRASQISKSIDYNSPVNSDFRPVAYFSQISYWLSWYGQKLWWVLALVVFGMLLLFGFVSSFNKSLLLTGFSASVIELIILMVFQIYFGQLYQAIALLISGFMIGLATGVWFAEVQSSKIKFVWLIKNQGLIGVFSLVIFLILLLVQEFTFPDILLKTLLYISMPILGGMTGLQFSFAVKLQKQSKAKVASSAYAIDLIGAAGGAILASVLLIPALGIPGSVLLVVGLNLLSIVFLWIKREA